MFGFFGKPISTFTFTCPTILISSTRRTGQLVGTLRQFYTVDKYIVDPDVNSEGAPDTIRPGSSAIAYTAATERQFESTEFSILSDNPISMPSDIGGYQVRVLPMAHNTTIRYAQWTSTTISPSTRTQRITHHNPDLVSHIVTYGSNNLGRSATSTNMNGSNTINYAQFPNLRMLSLYENQITSITRKWPAYLEGLCIDENFQLASITYKFPSSLKYLYMAGSNGGWSSSLNTLLEDCDNLEMFRLFGGGPYPTAAEPSSGLPATLDFSHMTNLKEILVPQNNTLTTFTLPSGITTLTDFHVQSTGLNTAAWRTQLDGILANCTGLKIFTIRDSQLTWTKTITDSTIPSGVVIFITQQNSITGDITITTSRPSMKYFYTGDNTQRAGAQQNSHPNVNITGLTAATKIDLSGCNIDSLILPVNTSITHLYIWDNHLDSTVNTSLISQIAAMTSLTDLRVGIVGTSTLIANWYGQDSINGLGANLDMSALSSCQTMSFGKCGITGTFTVPNTASLISLYLAYNSGLTGITNLNSHASTLSTLVISGTAITTSTSSLTAISNYYGADNTAITTLDLSGRTATSTLTVNSAGCTALTSVTMPTSQATCTIVSSGGTRLTFADCTSLTTITNLANVTYQSLTGTASNVFYCDNTAFNSAFPIGINNFLPTDIRVDNNNMTGANVDGTINNLYLNRTKWNNYTSSKSMDIAGTNAAAGGTYQAPSGFVLGVSDGTPASAKEQLYVLVNNYSWTMTYN